jgi:hypothetical protein
VLEPVISTVLSFNIIRLFPLKNKEERKKVKEERKPFF